MHSGFRRYQAQRQAPGQAPAGPVMRSTRAREEAQEENVTGSGYNTDMPETPPPAAAGEPSPAAAGTMTTRSAEPIRPAQATEPVQPAQPEQPALPMRPAQPMQPAQATQAVDAAVLPLVPSFGRPPGPRRPLPDAVAVHRLIVPQSAPPYDDELRTVSRSGQASRPDAPSGRLLPDGPQRPDRPAPAGTGVTAPPERDQAAAAGWTGQFAQVLAETLAGSRSPRQITPWTTEQARRHIRQLGPMLSAAQQPRVRRVITSCPAADVVEMTAIVVFGPRVRALAVRLERDGPQGPSPGRDARPARWLCTAVEAA
jgi:serralysin